MLVIIAVLITRLKTGKWLHWCISNKHGYRQISFQQYYDKMVIALSQRKILLPQAWSQ